MAAATQHAPLQFDLSKLPDQPAWAHAHVHARVPPEHLFIGPAPLAFVATALIGGILFCLAMALRKRVRGDWPLVRARIRAAAEWLRRSWFRVSVLILLAAITYELSRISAILGARPRGF